MVENSVKMPLLLLDNVDNRERKKLIMLNITAKYPDQMPDGSTVGTRVIIDGTGEHAGWHIPLDMPSNALNMDQSELIKIAEEQIQMALNPGRTLAEKFAKLQETLEEADKANQDKIDNAVAEMTLLITSTLGSIGSV